MKKIIIFFIITTIVYTTNAESFLIYSGSDKYIRNVSIAGNKVVWDVDDTVYLYDLDSKSQSILTTDGIYSFTDGQFATWQRTINNNEIEIWGENLSTSFEFLISNVPIPTGNYYRAAVAGEIVVWQCVNSSWDINAKNLFTGLTRGIATDDIFHEKTPDISSNKIVYEQQTPTGNNIVVYDLSVSRSYIICEGGLDGGCSSAYPKINGDIIVWQDYREGNWDVYGADISNYSEISVFPICQTIARQCAPSIDGNIVVWMDDRNGEFEVYGKNLDSGKEFLIHSAYPNEISSPKISGSIVVWREKSDSGTYDIYGIDLNQCLSKIPGDLNGDCKVDLVDLSILTSHWLECNYILEGLCD